MRTWWLLLRLDARRRLRTFGVMLVRRGGSARQPGRSSRYGCTYAFVTAYMTLVFFWLQVSLWEKVLQDSSDTAISWQILLVLLVTYLGDIANRDLFAGDWDLEWLLTLPVSRRSLMGVRALQRAFFNPLTRLLLWPSLTVLAWRLGYHWTAPLWGLALTLPLAGMVGSLLVLFETTARLRLSPGKLRNLGGLLSIVGILAMYLSMAPTFGTILPAPMQATGWLPWELPVRIFREGLRFYPLLLLQWLALAGLVQLALERMLRFGLVGAGVRERARPTRPGRRLPLPPILWREMLLLARDRTYFVNAVILPILLLVAQILANQALVGVLERPAYTGAVAFGMGSYALMFSAFQMLTREGQSLWLLYTLPCSLARVLREKAALWGCLASFYALLVLSVGWWRHGLPVGREWLLPFEVLAGLPLMAILATCLGAEAVDLTEPSLPQLRADLLYLFMSLVSVYGTALVLEDTWYRFVLMFLVGLLALAFWQKFLDRLPWLLDPSSRPRRLTLADGLLAVLTFFVVQIVSLLSWVLLLPAYPALSASYATAGLVTWVGARLLFRHRNLPLPSVGRLGPEGMAAAGGALACAVAGVLWLRLGSQWGWLEGMTRLAGLDSLSLAALYGMGVVCAPLFEEFLFRGLVYGGVRRLMSPGKAAAASALVFAVVHPPISVLPVFLLGVVTARLYERTGRLAPCMLAHAVFNAIMLTANVLLG